MGRIGRVLKSYVAKLPGSSKMAQWLSIEEFAGDNRKAQVFGPCNEDFAPPNNVKTIDFSMGLGRGFLVSGAYANEAIAPTAIAGERRLYSTNSAGDTVKTELFLKQDGTILVKNDTVEITITPGGNIEFTAVGDVIGTAATMQLNGNLDNLVMWALLNTPLQGLISALNSHTHGGSPNPDQTFALDINAARANSLQTSG